MSQLKYAATVSDHNLKLNDKADGVGPTGLLRPFSALAPLHLCQRVYPGTLRVCCYCCVCVLFFCVWEWVCVCVFAFLCCVYSVAWERESACCMLNEYSVHRYVRVILLSVFQSFFAICNNYSMRWYTWEKKRWLTLRCSQLGSAKLINLLLSYKTNQFVAFIAWIVRHCLVEW